LDKPDERRTEEEHIQFIRPLIGVKRRARNGKEEIHHKLEVDDTIHVHVKHRQKCKEDAHQVTCNKIPVGEDVRKAVGRDTTV
jgi:hypothetical protein